MGKLPTIAPELKDLSHIPINSLEPFQGDLKELSKREYAKLKKSLLDNGIIVPFFVWKETGKILDGHQRERVLINEGWLMDVPVIYISADNEQDAKQKLLVISSQYGRVTQEGWDDFTFDLDDEWIKQTVNFDALPLVFRTWGEGEGENDPYAEWQGMPEFEQEDKTSFRSIHVHFKNQEDVDRFAERIGQKFTDKTRAIWYPQIENINMRDYYDNE